MTVKIGHASIDERGRISGGTAGDQNGREVCTRNWYANGWTVLLRPKSADVAEKSAKACEAGCANAKIGYDQGQRNTLRAQAKKVGFDLSKITTPCETDCSAFMSVCAEAAGVNMDKAYSASGNAPTTSTMQAKFTATGRYTALTESKYLTGDSYLKRGDILVKAGYHTVMALSNGANAKPSVPDVSDKRPVSGTIAIVKRCNTYNSYSLNSVAGVAYVGEQHQAVESATVGGFLMYRTPNGRYIACVNECAKFQEGYDTRITYSAHCQTYGSLSPVANGCISGTVGEEKRLEAFTIVGSAPLEYRAHCQTYGWQDWKSNGQMAGTTGEAKRLEAIQIRRKDGGNIRYRVHMQGIGWGPWAQNGEIAGTTGEARRVEAIQIVFE